jgi:DNA-binding response OmpR family regulator
MTILVVEDDTNYARLLVNMLTQLASNVAVATNWTEAQDALRTKSPPDLLILDLVLPDSSRDQTLSQIYWIKNKCPGTLVFIVSAMANDTQELERIAFAAGADGAMSKHEIRPRGLLAAISRAFDRQKPIDEVTQKQLKVHQAACKLVLSQLKED